jgi:hypothetical protein
MYLDRRFRNEALTALPIRFADATVPGMSVHAATVLLRRLFPPAWLLLAVLWSAPALSASSPPRIVAVGDLHGDFHAWRQIAQAAGIINANGHWAGGKTVLVQLGDVTDRAPDSLKIVRSLQLLQKEAPRAGGKAIVVLGNHEAMNLLGDNRYTTPGEYAAMVDGQSAARRDRVYDSNRVQLEAFYKSQDPKLTPEQIRAKWMAEHPLGWVEHKLAWSPSGELGQWATRNPAIVKIGSTLFAHGGISAEYAKQPLEAVNKRVAAAMTAGDDSPASVLSDPLGPLWYRGLVAADSDAQAARAAAKPPAPPLTQDQELDAVLAAYGAQRLVIGHTPSLKGIQITLGGRLARIDTGDSAFYGGPLSWLEIIGAQMIPHTVARSP